MTTVREFRLKRRGAKRTVTVVRTDGETHPLRHRMYHSPTGMEWGYAGSGPADLARSMVAEVFGDAEGLSPAVYMRVKDAIVARVPDAGGTVRASEVIAVAMSTERDQ